MGRGKGILAVTAFAIAFGLTSAVSSGGLLVNAPSPTTLDQGIGPVTTGPFVTLEERPGEAYVIRDRVTEGSGFGEPLDGRFSRRRHLSYFGQLTDAHITDEESPARVEFLDPVGGAFTSAWRPAEALGPFEVKAMIEQLNRVADASPNRGPDQAPKRMDFVMNTGDVVDNQQFNEVLWKRQLLEGGTVKPGSGVDPAPEIGKNPLCPAGLEIKDANDPAAYTGVQDIEDWAQGTPGYFYDPNQPAPFGPDTEKINPYRSLPSWPGLMDRAQQPLQSPGVKVPSYVMTGNHDGLVQGNAAATAVFNRLATGCLKPMNDDQRNSGINYQPLFDLIVNPTLTIQGVLDLYADNPDLFVGVPPDPNRRLISKKSFKRVFQSGKDPRGHGFNLVDRAELKASDGTAAYYSFAPRRGMRAIVLDTVTDGGRILASSSGNIDSPQFAWLERELRRATRNNEIAVVFSHHPISSLTADVPDEEAPSCAEVDPKLAVGCDADPRISTPIKLAADATALMHRYPHAVAWIAGHTHQNRIRPYTAPEGKSGFWSIETSSLADAPKQARLLDLFDNRDGNLSLMTTLINHQAPLSAPPAGTPASGMSDAELAALSRVLSFNDSQRSVGSGEGTPTDRNTDLLIVDPRRDEPTLYPWNPRPARVKLKAGRSATVTVRVTNEGRSSTRATRLAVKAKGRGLKVRAPRRISGLEVGKTTTVRLRIKAKRKTRGKRSLTITVAGRSISVPVKIRR